MRKYVLLLLASIFAIGTAKALTAEKQLEAMKEIYVKEFQKMDDNKDGKISQDEYLSHQFEDFRAQIIESDGFSPKAPASNNAGKSAATTTPSLSDATATMQEMAEYDVDLDIDDDTSSVEVAAEPQKLTKEDVMPQPDLVEENVLPAIDLSVSEDENLKNILEEMEQTPTVEIKKNDLNPEEKAEQMDFMLETIKKTLPKKIDDITTWVDIAYDNDTISYIYKVDLDVTTFSRAERTVLEKSIEEEACVKARQDMCPKIKPMFIDEGTDMRIRYFDKNDEEFSACEFNKQTCN